MRELLRAGRRPVHRLLLAQTIDDSVSTELREWADRRGVPVRTVGRPELDRLAGTEAPQGVIALAAPLPDVELAELCRPAPDGRRPFLVVLDGVTDPHNVGAVARSALCAGATGMVIGRHRAAGLTPAAVKAAAGAVEYLPIATVAGVPAALSQLSEAGLWTVGLDASGPTELWDLQVATEAVAVVLGAEGRGLSRLTMQRCDVVAQIPNAGPLDSLNVSAAAALACYEVARRRSSDI